ncbi:MAG: NAD(P)/FAD-dependent oxidoreductase [Nitrospirae bacterium]|nr:NAD(P)/FAD-dependent oxidoreductase [Nitrospirota bacterium]
MKYLIIGNGVAGTAAAANIRKLDSSGDITIITDESTPFYSRIRLIEYLAGEAGEKDIVVYKNEWYEKNGIKLRLDTLITDIDKDQKHVITTTGERIRYDKLLLATGSYCFVPPMTGADKKGVFTLRTIRDADEVINYARGLSRALIVGGGVLGLEAGNALRKRGLEISVVEFFPRLLPRQMDPDGAEILKAQLQSMGFLFYLGAKSKEIAGNDKVQALILEDGTRIDCDLIIISAGVRPNAGLGKKLGLTINKGLVVNDRMETDAKDIYAAGDLIEHRGVFYGIWPAAQKQGEIAGINMAGRYDPSGSIRTEIPRGSAVYEGTTMSNVLKVAGLDLAAAGDIDADGKCESIFQKDREKFTYKKLVLKGNIIAGCILYGDISGHRRILKAIDEKKDISGIKEALARWDLNAL